MNNIKYTKKNNIVPIRPCRVIPVVPICMQRLKPVYYKELQNAIKLTKEICDNGTEIECQVAWDIVDDIYTVYRKYVLTDPLPEP